MIVVITQPFFFEGESERILELLARPDVDLVHIRKPHAGREQVVRLLDSLPREAYSHLVLHDHHDLAVVYGLHGIHLNGRNPRRLEGWHGSVSRSCHSLGEIMACRDEKLDYMSLSPIFDSISKSGYRAAFTRDELIEAHRQGIINERVLALGGVTFDRIDEVLEMGFGGAMILGDAWRQY
jgi:thiamine-phosphate pyrophosphorylase